MNDVKIDIAFLVLSRPSVLVSSLKKQSRILFINVIEQFLKRYLFTSGENNCSCAEDFAEDWACAVVFSEDVH
jgi:hypothetical protein